MTKPDVLAGRRRRDDVVDLHVAIGDHDAVDEQLDQLSALGEGGVGQALLHPLAEPVNRRHDLGRRLVLVHLGRQLPALTLQEAAALLERLPTPLILGERHRPGLIGISHPFNLALEVLDALLQLGPTGLQLLGQPRPGLCPLEGVGDALRMRQHVTQIPPDQFVEGLSRDIARGTPPLRVLRTSRRLAGTQKE